MNKYLTIALVAGLCGTLVGRYAKNLDGARTAVAQQVSQRMELPPLPETISSTTGSTGSSTNWQPIDNRSGGFNSGATFGGLTPDEQANISVYENNNQSVVNITTLITRDTRSFFMQAEPARGSGSGFVIDRNGHILTNHHVIEDARSARVTLYNGQSYSAELVGTDPPNDMAVLKIDAPQELLNPIQLGDSGRLRVGQKVYAIGNPFGLERTLTVGVLSSQNRTLPSKSGRTMKSILQIDAALNRGNSGGPLFDSRGRLIGMNTAIASPSGRGENTGIGFAIPVSTLRRVVPQLISNGRVIRADAGIAKVLENGKGLVVAELVPNGPAERAGVRGFAMVQEQRGGLIFKYIDRSRADMVIGVDGNRIRSADEFLELIESRRPGDRVVLSVIRDNSEVDVPIVLGTDR
ncbi:MAG: trypsin-like peptidase domain-containing protein [Planctomycetota bacterium]